MRELDMETVDYVPNAALSIFFNRLRQRFAIRRVCVVADRGMHLGGLFSTPKRRRSKLIQICSISSAASGSLSRAHWYRHGSLLRRPPLRRCAQEGQIPKAGRPRCRATWRSIRSRSLTNWPRKWVGSASPASTSNWKGSRARIAFALSVRSTRALRPSVSDGIRAR